MARRTRLAAVVTLAMINVFTLAAGITVARMLPPRLESAAIPFVRMQELSGTEFTPRRALRRIFYRFFRKNIWRGLGLKPRLRAARQLSCA